MKKILLAILASALFAGCIGNNAASSPWDNTSWVFKGSITGTTAMDPEFSYYVQLPDGFTLNIENAKEGKYTSDWFAGSTMELNDDGNIRLHYTYSGDQVIGMGSESLNFSQSYIQEMIVSRDDDQHATGYFSQTQKFVYDGETSEYQFSGILKGERTK